MLFCVAAVQLDQRVARDLHRVDSDCHRVPERSELTTYFFVGRQFVLERLDRVDEAALHAVRPHLPHAGDVKLRGDKADFEKLTGLLARYPEVMIDNSALALIHRKRRLMRILAKPDLAPRVLHGSDFPLPSHAWAFALKLGVRKTRAVGKIPSPLEREIVLKRELGVPDQVFTQAVDRLRVPGGVSA